LDDVRWEVVVVDNASSDATRAVVEGWTALGALPIRYVFESRVGLCVARNRGVRATTAPLLAFTDDDVVTDSDWLAELLDAQRTGCCDVVGGRIRVAGEDPFPSWLDRSLLGCLGELDLGDEPVPFDGRQTYPFGANMLFRREWLERAGGFDERLGRVGEGRRWREVIKGEEQVLVARILRAGGRAMYAPGAVVEHRVERCHLQRGHFRRLYFAAGYQEIALAGSSGRDATPPSRVACAKALFWFAKLRAQRGADAAFRRQLNALHLLGMLAGSRDASVQFKTSPR
jgi:glycosyltransferase involved in cell wall biosynthesis